MNTTPVTIEMITPELRYELRCIDARAYARKLRRDGYAHPDILNITTEIWGADVAKHIEGCQATGYFVPSDERPTIKDDEDGIKYQHGVE